MIDRFEDGGHEIEVLYLDNHLLCVVKPPNMPVQADASCDRDLLSACKAYVKARFAKPGAVYLGLVHRLDRPVGGAMVFARTSKAAARLSRDWAQRAVTKRYLAVVRGAVDAPARLVDYLFKDERTGMVRVVCEGAPGAKRAELVSTPIAARDGLTLVEVELMTGRAHQIRVQHAHAGNALWGDARYGGGRPGEQIALWAHRLSLRHPTTGEAVELLSRPPQCGAWARFSREMEELYEA